MNASPEIAPDYTSWVTLVEKIRANDEAGMAELYQVFSKGVRFILRRRLGERDVDDRLHDIFLIVAQAIRRGDLREPERLMGFVQTIVRRQVASQIDAAVHRREHFTEFDIAGRLFDPAENPERAAIAKQNHEIAMRVLQGVPKRDREILVRFYLQEQSQEQICREMNLNETQFRLIKSRAKARFGELGRKRLSRRSLPRFW